MRYLALVYISAIFLKSNGLDDCHPYISEISSLKFRSTAKQQYIELAVKENCRKDDAVMKKLKLSSYGLLAINTKSPLMDAQENFFATTLVDYNNQKWPKSTEYQAFFVVGSQERGDVDVPNGNFPRAQKRIHFNFFSTRASCAKCSRFVNWPFCDRSCEHLEGQSSLKQYFASSSQTERPRIHGEDYLLRGQTAFMLLKLNGEDASDFIDKFSYVQTVSGHTIYSEDRLHITREKQQWLSQRIVDIVVFTPSNDLSVVIPMERMDLVWSHLRRPMIFYVLPPDLLTDSNSISLCPHSQWAVSSRTPGYDNVCEGEGFTTNLLQWEKLSNSQSPIHALDEQNDVLSLSRLDDPIELLDASAPSESFRDTSGTPRPASYIGFGVADERFSVLDGRVKQLLEMVQVMASKQNHFFNAHKALAQQAQQTSNLLHHMMDEMRERSELHNAEIEQAEKELKIQFGLYLDTEGKSLLSGNLKKLRINDVELTQSQIRTLLNKPYLRYYRHPSFPNADFMRCSLCNRESAEFDPLEAFAECARSDTGRVEKKVNLLGKDSVFCMKKLSSVSSRERPHLPFTRLLERLSVHESSKEHMQHMDEFFSRQTERKKTTADDIAATVTSSLAAYTIAKQGLPFSTQFPLLITAMRTGSIGVSAHHDPTTVRRMVTTFATHMKYDILKYVMTNKLPFTLLLDGSTSSRGVKWIVFLLRTVSPQHRPITLHFFIAEVESESAEHIVEALLRHFDSMESWRDAPGLPQTVRQYALRNMIALSTDGAAVMQGHVGGVYALLKDRLTEETAGDLRPRSNLLLSVCMAHKLNLVIASQNGNLFKLVQAVIMEMHHLLGSTVRTTGRAAYHMIAKKMRYKPLEMLALFTVRWSASLANAVSNVIRMYPVLIETMRELQRDRYGAATVRRARIAHWVLTDGRVFLALNHANTTLQELSLFSMRLQNEEALLIDNIRKWRELYYLIAHVLSSRTTTRLLERGELKAFDTARKKYRRIERGELYSYDANSGGEEWSNNNLLLSYNPRAFQDHNPSLTAEDDSEEGEEMLASKQFRYIEGIPREVYTAARDPEQSFSADDAPEFDKSTLSRFNLGRAYHDFASTSLQDAAERFYNDVKNQLLARMGETRVHEVQENDLTALEKSTIMDVVDFDGDFDTGFVDYVPSEATYVNRGCPSYINPVSNVLNPQERHLSIYASISALERYCNIQNLRSPMIRFYNTIPKTAKTCLQWNSGYRDMQQSASFYQMLLANSDSLQIPDEVVQALRCVVVVPASNADPERSFSAANRLTKDERSNLATSTLDSLMTIQRDGPSILTVKIQQLAAQWLHPRPGLNLHQGRPSTFGKEGSLMKEIKTALASGDVNGLIVKHTEHYMSMHGLRTRRDVKEISTRLQNEEEAKLAIFSIGSKGIAATNPSS
ncbi:unnamed protein product [Cylicostephanus goldi]|uniref:HAT C-terminal dimerisation domain-containing protein n=1 Tax=Cylicostephanus goldi TaxID=71465 RepID=A0A3P6PYU2_CYLGO|nr:unnamed protein product [Cylicostephanus goldi]